ncbi:MULTISPECIES: MFS transporter [Staphylococcus]|jgi:DHA1 family inner membrane transport protein|uniref:MFS transporter n=1 Tax=Staphylococcus nepalensis TaxID=214473 RepID=A0A291JN68_9STAP|nr:MULTISPECIES: MFS transporter [Staphylococcus]ATH60878.1 arabinose transporter permease [Staphylococcus nepalensis]ATH65910.1 arabinose transporter permease [Staphylococcus nepalensis]AWI45299.1 arabinose transporter permease [Staphylococcus nepalensis]MBO1206539.1 MFS transporter [Staphylococcus nepalensis]MBO1214299.1 MFS transporter [Staphylococcus nepalensis]
MKYPIAIWMLAIGAFAIGMTEFVIMGLLPNIARDFDVSVSQAGQLITGYALGVAIGGPIIVMLTIKWNRKYLLLALMTIFIIGNFAASFSPSYGFMMTSRIITSLAHGSFFGIGSILAASMVKPEKRASAMALMFMGLSMSNILGVPFGTLIGQNFGWPMTFIIISIIGALALIGIIIFVPMQKETVKSSVLNELKILKEKRLWLTLAVTLFGFSSVFAYFTYISTVLIDVSHVQENLISYLLIIFGVGVTLGNIVGGKLADWNLNKALKIIFSVFILYFILLYFVQMNGLLMVAGIFFFGLIGFSMSPSLQYKSTLISQDAPTLASTLNQSAFNLGNALGAFIGGVVVTNLPVASLSLVAPILTAIGLIFLFINVAVEKKESMTMS